MLNLLEIGQQTWKRVKHTQPADSSIEDYYRFLWNERKNVRVGYSDGRLDWLLVAERADEILDVKLLVLLGQTKLADVIAAGQQLFGPFDTVKYRRRINNKLVSHKKLWETASKLCNHPAQ